jgi:hypothetical protein
LYASSSLHPTVKTLRGFRAQSVSVGARAGAKSAKSYPKGRSRLRKNAKGIPGPKCKRRRAGGSQTCENWPKREVALEKCALEKCVGGGGDLYSSSSLHPIHLNYVLQ